MKNFCKDKKSLMDLFNYVLCLCLGGWFMEMNIILELIGACDVFL